MFVLDILYEFELGVWKAIFSHLMRILYASRDNCITVLNWRYVCYKIYMSVSIYEIDIDMFRAVILPNLVYDKMRSLYNITKSSIDLPQYRGGVSTAGL